MKVIYANLLQALFCPSIVQDRHGPAYIPDNLTDTPGATHHAGGLVRSVALPRPISSEVNDEVGGANDGIAPVGSYSRIDVAIERRGVERTIVGDLGTDLDLRREPVLPAERDIGISSRDAGALSLRIVEIFGAQRKSCSTCSANR